MLLPMSPGIRLCFLIRDYLFSFCMHVCPRVYNVTRFTRKGVTSTYLLSVYTLPVCTSVRTRTAAFQ